jgi:hypothetical protein
MAAGSKVPVSETARYIFRNRRTMLCHNLGFAMITLATTAGTAWIPEMFRRNFHWSIPKFGAYSGIEVAVFGCLGAFTARAGPPIACSAADLRTRTCG